MKCIKCGEELTHKDIFMQSFYHIGFKVECKKCGESYYATHPSLILWYILVFLPFLITEFILPKVITNFAWPTTSNYSLIIIAAVIYYLSLVLLYPFIIKYAPSKSNEDAK